MHKEASTADEMGDYKVKEVKIREDQKQNYQQQNPNADYHYNQTIAGRPVYVQGPPQPPPPVDATRAPRVHPRRSIEETFDEEVFQNSFDTVQIRHRFVRKVYLLLSVLLSFTAGVIAIFVFEENANKFARENPIVGMVFSILFLVTFIAMTCCQNLMRKTPINLIALGIFTLISSINFGFIAALYSPEIVLYSAAITAGICLLITLIACQTWIDITGWGIYLCIFSMVLFLFAMVLMILSLTVGVGHTLMLVYSCLAGLLFSAYFMFTTQLILGGRKYEMSPEEYIYAVVILYVEILMIFMLIMSCFRR